jgi:Protein of unknown function (DUF2892)
MSFARFMASTAGRAIRVIAGLVLIAVGLSVGGGGGIAVAIVGGVALLAGALNVCLIAPLLKAPFSGKRLVK